MKEVIIDGKVFVPKEEQELTQRCVVVIDRGWVYAGDVTRENGRIILSNAVWVFKWLEIGFNGLLDNPRSENVQIRKMNQPISIPEHSELFSVHVDNNWGL